MKADYEGEHCIECGSQMQSVIIKTTPVQPLGQCNNDKCNRYGLIQGRYFKSHLLGVLYPDGTFIPRNVR